MANISLTGFRIPPENGPGTFPGFKPHNNLSRGNGFPNGESGEAEDSETRKALFVRLLINKEQRLLFPSVL